MRRASSSPAPRAWRIWNRRGCSWKPAWCATRWTTPPTRRSPAWSRRSRPATPTGQPGGVPQADVQFHRVLAEIPGNPIFVALHEAFVERLMKGRKIPSNAREHFRAEQRGAQADRQRHPGQGCRQGRGGAEAPPGTQLRVLFPRQRWIAAETDHRNVRIDTNDNREDDKMKKTHPRRRTGHGHVDDIDGGLCRPSKTSCPIRGFARRSPMRSTWTRSWRPCSRARRSSPTR